ncbi:hypothetical protein [Bacillus sp. RS11]|uniref:hypothetical protein n=1 Tax=Lysinibacillus sp. RS11 TaxID=3242682 RepID=UPI0035C69616
MKKIATALLSSALLISPVAFSSPAEASTLAQQGEFETDINELVPTAPSDSENLEDSEDFDEVDGKDKPGKKASTHNISKSAYNYQVSKVGAQVYTDKFITGKKSMEITVKNWEVKTNWNIPGQKLTITLYDSSDKVIDSETVDMTNRKSDSVSFSGLSASSKYYVEFSVPQNKQTYSFDGSIS